MRYFFLLLLFIFLSFDIKSQNLDKIRVVCLDEVDVSTYQGELSKRELQDQIAALGFRYIKDGQIKYHDELIVYNCNTGALQFTAEFDENRLVKEFVLYESKDILSKKIRFSKKPTADQVDLKLKYKGQEIPAYPIGKTEIFSRGKLTQTINFKEEGGLPVVTNYDANLKKTSEGTATVSGFIQDDWDISKTGEWKYYENDQIASISVFDKSGNETIEKLYNQGNLIEEHKFLPNGNIQVTQFYENGNIKDKGSKDGNTKIGTWEYYQISGELDKELEYISGQITRQLIYDNQSNVIKKLVVVEDHSKLPRTLQKFDVVYQLESFYANGELKSVGYQAEKMKVGVYEYFDKSGELNEISEYNVEGNKINSVEADTYLAIEEKEKEIFRELLVAKTTNPGNLDLLSSIGALADSLSEDFDSLMGDYNYKNEFEERYSALYEKTASFGNLSNSLSWYDSLLTTATEFNNEVWAYSEKLFEIELALERKIALERIEEMMEDFKKEYTSSKKTLFGSKMVVLNDQEEIYESITKEIYPSFRSDIKSTQSKYSAQSTVEEFNRLLKKGASIIDQPDEQFRETLKNTKSVKDKKQLFLTLK
jgi:antitoxin component YwqK of YwqJK toxin-antitoxin module